MLCPTDPFAFFTCSYHPCCLCRSMAFGDWRQWWNTPENKVNKVNLVKEMQKWQVPYPTGLGHPMTLLTSKWTEFDELQISLLRIICFMWKKNVVMPIHNSNTFTSYTILKYYKCFIFCEWICRYFRLVNMFVLASPHFFSHETNNP